MKTELNALIWWALRNGVDTVLFRPTDRAAARVNWGLDSPSGQSQTDHDCAAPIPVDPGRGAVGSGTRVVEQGDSIQSLAAAAGFHWQTIWDLPDNADLRRTRRDPGILLPGDRVSIPDIRPKVVKAGTDTRHHFRLRGRQTRDLCRAQRLGLPAEGPVVLFAGRLVEKKGVAIVVEACRRLPHVRFLLVGDGPLRNLLRDGLANVSWRKEVRADQMPEYYQAADCLLLPSHD
jgi:glycosyltransferase involved in cell wall biosynthesis